MSLPHPPAGKLLVEVSDGLYGCYGDPTDPKVQWLAKVLEDQGGIANTVEDGLHIFDAEVLDDNTIVVTLEPFEQ